MRIMIAPDTSSDFDFFDSTIAARRETAAGRNQPSQRAQAQAGKVCREGTSSLGWLTRTGWGQGSTYRKGFGVRGLPSWLLVGYKAPVVCSILTDIKRLLDPILLP